MSIRSLFLAAALLGADLALAADTAVPEVSATAATAAALQKADAARRNADYKDAYALYKTLAEQGNARAEAKIGTMYALGELGKRDMAEAIAHYDKAAEADDGYAQFLLGVAFRDGSGVEKHDTESGRWFAKAEENLRKAALRQDAEAQYLLGIMYRDGINVVESKKESGRWLQKAAEKGNPSAQVAYGHFLYDENEDTAGLLTWWEKAAAQGEIRAQLNLASAYTKGYYGVSKNQAKADEWYRRALPTLEKAALQGAIAAQTSLGERYLRGEGFAANPEKAQEWLEKAATQDNVAAQVLLGRGYLKGEGLPADPEKARLWLEKAATQGNKIARSLLDELPENK